MHHGRVSSDDEYIDVVDVAPPPLSQPPEDLELFWTQSFSGRPHFVTLLASRQFSKCEVMVLANEVDENYKADWSRPWPYYKAQLDEISKTIIESEAVPKDLSSSQIMLIGTNITIIDYEMYRRMATGPPQKHRLDEHDRTSSLFKLEINVWTDWLIEGRHTKKLGLGTVGVSLARAMKYTFEEKLQEEMLWGDLLMRPLQFESITGEPTNVSKQAHCILRQRLLNFMIDDKSLAIGRTKDEEVGVQGQPQEAASSAVEQAFSALQECLPITKMFARAFSFFRTRKQKQDQGHGEIKHTIITPSSSTTAQLLKLDVVVFNFITSRENPSKEELWADSELRKLSVHKGTKPAVVLLYSWESDTGATSAWPQIWRSSWYKLQLQTAQQYQAEGLDVSIIGQAVAVPTAQRAPRASHRVLHMGDLIQVHFSSLLLSPVPSMCVNITQKAQQKTTQRTSQPRRPRQEKGER
jgi:hypothetical protein